MIHYYVDPGSGFVFAQGASFLWGVILAALGGCLFFFRNFFGFFKKYAWFLLIGLAVLIIGGVLMRTPVQPKKAVVIGIDAMDPKITEQLMRAGRLPNLASLKAQGTYAHLATTVSSETAVAWSSFVTGRGPGGHGIFDFVMRDPATYMPYLSLNEISGASGQVEVKMRRKGEDLWALLSRAGIACHVYFCPNTFPPQKLNGAMLSGLGVPDITGVIGRFTYYTTQTAPSPFDQESRGKIIRVQPQEGKIATYLAGPKARQHGEVAECTVPLGIVLPENGSAVTLELAGKRILLNVGAWSAWCRVSFKVGTARRVHGIVRFYLQEVRPQLRLYATPVNFDPEQPPFPISYPSGFSRSLAKKLGLFYTQGMPHDTWALSEERIGEEAFLAQAEEILASNEKMLTDALGEFRGGMLFFYFETLDVIQHMFWHTIDSQSPLYEAGSPYRDVIYAYYEKLDRIIGEVMRRLDKETLLMVVSDHGFSSFRRAAHLNRWLLENGYLHLAAGRSQGGEFLEGVDWQRTQAYALGFGGIYLNRTGREAEGIVTDADVGRIKKAVAAGLRAWRDPATAEPVVKDVYDADAVYRGPYQKDAPDLFVGFNTGYRASWQTALGAVPPGLLDDNMRKWSGDHLIDPQLVPGVLFINRKVRLPRPAIIDLAPTLARYFGITAVPAMDGEAFILPQE